MSQNIQYGYIIQLNSSKSEYEDKYFFVERILEDEISLRTQESEKLVLTGSLKENDIDSITIVYIPDDENKGFIRHNKLRPNKWIEVIFEEDDTTETFQGKIISIDNDVLEILGDTKTIYLPVEFGLPKLVSSIKQISQPRHTMTRELPERAKDETKKVIPNKIREILDAAEEGEVIGFVNEELESNQMELFYTVEQQKLELLDHLLIGIDESKRTTKLMQKFHNVIQRFTELRNKYTKFNKRIEPIRLPSDQYLNTVQNNTNPYFSPLSSNRVQIKRLVEDLESDIGDENDEADFRVPSYYNILEPETVNAENGHLINDPKEEVYYNTLIQDYFRLKNKFTESFITTINHVTENEKFENITEANPIKIYLQLEEVLPVRIYQPYVFNSYVTQPLSAIESIKTTFRGSTILEKANRSRVPYYETIFRIPDKEDSVRHISVDGNFNSNEKCNLFDHNKVTVFKNECDKFSTFVTKMMPSFEEYIQCYLDPYFVSYNQAIKQLESLSIHEMNTTTYKIIHQLLKKNINELRNLENSQRKMNLNTRNTGTLYTIKTKMNDRITPTYVKLEDTAFYSTSELQKYGGVDSFKYYSLQYILDHQALLNPINDGSLKVLIEQIKQDFDNPQVKENERIHKVYRTDADRVNDNNKPIVFQDVLWEGQNITITDYLHIMVIQNGYTFTKEQIHEKMGQIVDKGIDQVDIEFPLDMVAFVKDILTKYKIMKNQIAEVSETKKTYFWNGTQWRDRKEQDDYAKKKLVSVKGKDLDMKKDFEFKKRVADMIQDYEISLIRQIEIDKIGMQDAKHLKKLRSLQHQKLLQEMTYNNQRHEYALIELHKDKVGVTVSPHEELKQRILKEYVPFNRYTLIQQFVNKFTKNGDDPYWFYCIDSGVKLLPTFYFELANVFLLNNSKYKETLDKISVTRGTINDNMDFVIDKYSGYPIMKMDFDEEEGFNTDGGINKFHDVIEPDVISQNTGIIRDSSQELIYNAVEFFFNTMGIIVDEEIISNVSVMVDQTVVRANRNITKEDAKNQGIVYSIMSHCLLHVQTTIDSKLKFTKPFPGCSRKNRFGGFPLVKDDKEYDGIKYLCCIVKKIGKPSAPWSSMRSIREEKMLDVTVKFIETFILTSFTFEASLNEKRNHVKIVSEIEVPVESIWLNFNPRLKPIKPISGELPHSGEDKIMLYSFIIQNQINEHISKQSALLLTNTQQPEMVNTCCNKNNNVLEYMLENTKIQKELQMIMDIKKHDKKIFTELHHMYSPMSTKFARPMLSLTLSEPTIYKGVIKWFEMDTNQEIPDYLKKRFSEIVKTDDYDKNDTLDEKIRKLNNGNIKVSEGLFYDILKTISERGIITERTMSKYETDDNFQEFDQTNKIDKLLMNNEFKQLYDYCSEYTTSVEIKKICESTRLSSSNKKNLDKCLRFNTQFETEKNNDIIPAEVEHYNFMNQILLNKINLLITTYPEKIKNGTKLSHIVPKHWDLHQKHIMMVNEFVNSYYSGIEKYYQNENILKLLDQVDTQKYKRWLQYPIKNQKYKNSLYYYIFIMIFKDYIALNNEVMNTYISVISASFVDEDKTALNFSKKRIDFETSASKKSETEMKTKMLGDMQKDARRAQNTMKELKLGEWSVGLGKSLFEYDKGVFMDVYNVATEIESKRTKYTPEDSSEFDPTMGHDDGDVPEETQDMFG